MLKELGKIFLVLLFLLGIPLATAIWENRLYAHCGGSWFVSVLYC